MSADGGASPVSDKAKKAARKAALRAEAEALGVSYADLKAQKKAAKEEKKKKKRSREADRLRTEAEDIVDGAGHRSEMKRMRTWSKDFEDGAPPSSSSSSPAEGGNGAKRPRTRSRDLLAERKEEGKGGAAAASATKSEEEPSERDDVTPEEWRKSHRISIRGHGSAAAEDFPAPYLKFGDAPFCPAIQRALTGAGFEKPTPIQSQAWPIAVKGQDMISIAKTGSGKTCGFLLPSLHQHLESRGGGHARGPHRGGGRPVLLVLAPTRELACQIMEETQKFGRPLGVQSVCCYGGSSKYPQIATLQRGVDCVIATPGRLNDLLEMKKVDLSGIKFAVLDEADRMLDMGFEPQIRAVLEHVPKERQTMLFSATWPKEIQRLAHDFLRDPVQINVGDADSLNANRDITQNIVMCGESEKLDRLEAVLKELSEQGEGSVTEKDDPRRQDLGGKRHPKVIVFVAKKVSCNDLANRLWDDGFAVDSLHGDRPQWERTKVINAFKNGTLRMLIATDVAARGLDVKDVGAVVNYDMPIGVNGVEDYVHRIGRTGRAGAKGVAHTFFTRSDSKCATKLVEVLRKAGQDVPAELQAMVRPRRVGGRGGGGRGRGAGGYSGGRGGRGYMMGGGGRGGRGRSFGRGGGRGFGRGGRGGGGRGRFNG